MVCASDARVSWQTTALEFLRRRAGGAPHMPVPSLRGHGAAHEAELVRKRIESLYFVTCGIDHPRQRLYQALWDAQAREASAIIEELCALGVEPVVFKGAEITARYDAGVAIGERSDVDLLVPVDSLWKAKKVLFGRGYVQGNYVRETRSWGVVEHFRQLRHEAQAYELWPFRTAVDVGELDEAVVAEAARSDHFLVEDGRVRAIVKVDVHHNILFDFDLRPFLDRTIAGALGVGRALSPADHLWFSIYRYYGEVAIGWKRTLRGLAAIAPIVRDPEVDWAVLVDTAIRKRATAPCLYWLTFFRSLGAPVPDAVLPQLRAHHDRSERNWGWQLERLFEIEETLPTALS